MRAPGETRASALTCSGGSSAAGLLNGGVDAPGEPRASATACLGGSATAGWHALCASWLPNLALRSTVASRIHKAFRRDVAQFRILGTNAVGRRSPRVRARLNRRRIAALLSVGAQVAVQWLRYGRITSNSPYPSANAWMRDRLRSQVNRASRIDPFSFEGDKRGRVKDLVSNLLQGSSLGPGLGGVKWFYSEVRDSTSANGPPDFDAAKLAVPKESAIISISHWLHPTTVASWNTPEVVDCEKLPVGYFKIESREWRAALRKMKRSGLIGLKNKEGYDRTQAAGAFNVVKDAMATRFIGDRRPANAVEATIGKAKLPEVQRLRRIILDPDKVARVHFRDFKNCFFIFAVDEDRLSRQVVGPLVPREWRRACRGGPLTPLG